MKIDDKLNMIDEKVSPEKGHKTWKLFSTLNLLWIILVLPILVLVFGAILKPNTDVSFSFDEIQSRETTIVKNVKVSAGSQTTLGNINVNSETPMLSTAFTYDYSVGTSTPLNTNVTEITGAFTVTDNDQEIIFDGVDGEELSLYAVPLTSGPGIDYSNYQLVAENSTDKTYDVTIVSDPSSTLIDLGSGIDSASFNLSNIDGSFINTEINLGIAFGVFATWILIEIIILTFKWYFGKWEYYVEPKGGVVND